MNCSFLSDYCALGKTRLILHTAHFTSFIHLFFIFALDLAFSIVISTAFVFVFTIYESCFRLLPARCNDYVWIFTIVRDSVIHAPSYFLGINFFHAVGGNYFWFYYVTFMSTLLTSTWLGLIILSTVLIKLMAPIQHFTVWFFDVEKHPLKAIGIVAAVLAMTASLVLTVFRAIT
jgi:hypothetical protein